MKPLCRQCQSASVASLGRIPDGHLFAGQRLEPAWPGGKLFECQQCGLGFRHPIREQKAYEDLYETASEKVWVTERLRPDQLRIKVLIESLPDAKSVLDVGCYDGTLLGALNGRFDRYGVEASILAADVARSRGVEILGARISDLPGVRQRFDVVCAVDVIEHVPNPGEFTTQLVRLLNPGGLLIVSTGAIDAPAWRLAGGNYWYCSFAEHISFISLKWGSRTAADQNLTLRSAQRFSYADLPPAEIATGRRRFCVHLAKVRIKQLLASLPGLEHRASSRVVGEIGWFRDHLMLVFSRSDATLAGGQTASGALS